TGLVLGAEGEQLSSRPAFERATLTKADPALSLAFASLVEGFAPEDIRAWVPVGPEVAPDLIARPLFGLEPDGVLIRWGGLSGDEMKSLPAHPWTTPIARQGLGVLSLWGGAYADGEPAV